MNDRNLIKVKLYRSPHDLQTNHRKLAFGSNTHTAQGFSKLMLLLLRQNAIDQMSINTD